MAAANDLASERQALFDKFHDTALHLTGMVDRINASKPDTGGSCSDIYKGYWLNPTPHTQHDTLALKFIRSALLPRQADKIKALKSLKQEISVWRDSEHPNILPFRGVAWYDGWDFPVLVSTWEENGNMTEYLDKVPRSTPANELHNIKLGLLKGVLSGLDYLHGKSIIHADVKGTNVLVSSERQALLCDFGISWTDAKRSVSFTLDRPGKGTPAYMAPEFFLSENVGGSLIYSPASDMWAFGCLMYEVFHGVPPWVGRNQQQVGMAHLRGEQFQRPENIAEDLWHAVAASCQREPSDRSTAAEVRLILENV